MTRINGENLPLKPNPSDSFLIRTACLYNNLAFRSAGGCRYDRNKYLTFKNLYHFDIDQKHANF
jgi:hypothetical protein